VSVAENNTISIYFDIGFYCMILKAFIASKEGKKNAYIMGLCRLNLAPTGQLSDNDAPFLSV